MAVIQMGAIVTKIKGSIGGTAFKIQRGTQVMYRKSNGYSKDKLLANSSLGYARSIFQKWSFLSGSDKLAWNNQAAILFFPDKFGNPVHITGRQLFTKCNLNLRALGYYASPPEGFTPLVSLLTIEPPECDFALQVATCGIETESIGNTYVSLSLEVSLSPLPVPSYVSRKVIKTQVISTTDTFSFFDEMMENYPYITPDYYIRCYFTSMNEYGLKGSTYDLNLNFVG